MTLAVSPKVSVTASTGQTAFWMRPDSELDRILLHAIRSRIIASEARFPGSGEVCTSVLVRASSAWIRREKSGFSQYEIRDQFERSSQSALGATPIRRRLRVEDLALMLSRVPESQRSHLINLVSHAPLGCLVSVKRSRLAHTTITETQGCRIAVGSSSPPSQRPVCSPRVVLFDGAIDSVGQIHRVLSDAAERGTHYLIGCRSASSEVEQTIRVNCARGTVNVLIFFARLDDLSIGALDDVAAYVGAEVVGSQMGESISTRFDRLTGAVGKFWLDGSHLRSDSAPHASVQDHISRLRFDASQGDQSVQEFLMGRVLGASSYRAELHIGEEDARRDPVIVESVDSDVRSLAASFTRGVSETIPHIDAPVWLSEAWDTLDLIPRSAGSIESGIASGLGACLDLFGAGCAITLSGQQRSDQLR